MAQSDSFAIDSCVSSLAALVQYTVRTSPNPNRGVYEVKLTNVSTIHTSDLARLISAAPAADPLAPQNTIPVTLLQVIISQAPHMQVAL